MEADDDQSCVFGDCCVDDDPRHLTRAPGDRHTSRTDPSRPERAHDPFEDVGRGLPPLVEWAVRAEDPFASRAQEAFADVQDDDVGIQRPTEIGEHPYGPIRNVRPGQGEEDRVEGRLRPLVPPVDLSSGYAPARHGSQCRDAPAGCVNIEHGGGATMKIDPIAIQLDELDRACLEMRQRIETLHLAIVEIRHLRAQRRPISEIVAHGPGLPARKDVRGSWSRLNETLHAFRVQVVRTMVDAESMSITDVARVTGNARQVVSRLYHAAPT
jgi:hypothetical protein